MRVRPAVLASALLALAGAARAYPNFPPVPRAGDPPLNLTCNDAGCHESFALNAGAVTLALLDFGSRQPVTLYEPGVAQELVIRVSALQAGRGAWGFELVFLAGSAQAGTLVPGAGAQIQPDSGRSYLSHLEGGIGLGQTTGHEWRFTWTPPATDVGTIRVYACGNAADGGGSNFNDYIECTTFDLAPDVAPPDADSDGLTDDEEVARGTNPQDADTDDDLVLDGADTCPLHAGGSQADLDADGFGEPCDACDAFADPQQEDADADGVGDACEIQWADILPRGGPPNGVDIADAVVVLRMAVMLETPTAEELRRADVSPADVVPGPAPQLATPQPQDTPSVDIGDAVLTLRAAVGLVRFATPE